MGVDEDDDNQRFRANFSSDGAAKLRNIVCEKLKEFMGDYTDDTLVEYVIVLLKNGRKKGEAKNELNVFLGDDSDSFVSWLWDYLGSSLHLYVEPPSEDQAMNDSRQLISGSDNEKSDKQHRSRHNREWRSIVRDEEAPPPFKSTIPHKAHLNEKAHRMVNRAMRSTSPEKAAHQKRSRPEELPQARRLIASQETNGASRRLLQFAVRDAVATSKPSISTSEPALKRLRSVVSTSAADSSVEKRPRRLQSLAFVPNAMSTAMRAIEEAAKDVAKSSISGNVFDRLGLPVHASHTNDRLTELDEPVSGNVDYDVFKETSAQTRSTHAQGKHHREYRGDLSMLETNTCLASDSVSDNEGFDQVNVLGQRVTNASRTTTSGKYKDEDGLMVKYTVANNGDQSIRKHVKEQDLPASNVGVNISVNVNTWKPPHYQKQEEMQQVVNQKTVQNIEPGVGRSSAWPMKEISTAVSVANGTTKPTADIQNVSQKIPPATLGLYATTGRPAEDVDSRTIFVSNVHFAATKDSLSKHFNKFGEVLKVIIMTDAATGQPKGSAYIEFTRKEAAERALSLDATSFMSRILKVVKKSSAHQDTLPITTWPRVVRGSPFSASARFGRGFLPRGISRGGAYMARPPIKAGVRSLQWKREEANTTPSQEVNNAMTTNNNNNSSIASLSSGIRSLTYVRTNQNTNGHSATST